MLHLIILSIKLISILYLDVNKRVTKKKVAKIVSKRSLSQFCVQYYKGP